MSSNDKPLRRLYRVGEGTHVIAIAPAIIRKLNLNEETFMEEEAREDGVYLKIRRLQ